jgi:uncharacterized repeat protein (TIGR03803 family)
LLGVLQVHGRLASHIESFLAFGKATIESAEKRGMMFPNKTQRAKRCRRIDVALRQSVGSIYQIESLERRVLLSGFATLASFPVPGGTDPKTPLVMDSTGDLFGTTYSGGEFNDGTLFEVAVGSTSITTLASFNGTDGSEPDGGLILDSAGNLYGNTYAGGAHGEGSVFEVVKGSNQITTLASFVNLSAGTKPVGRLVVDGSGDLYGVAKFGGPDSLGILFEVVSGSNTVTQVAVFNSTTGGYPLGGLVADSNGNLFGTTSDGGTSNDGTIYELAKGSNSISALASFNENTTGALPEGELLIDGKDDLYGTTSLGGTVFELPVGGNSITVLAPLQHNSAGGLVMDAKGNLFGTTPFGQDNTLPTEYEDGTVFELASGGNSVQILASFNGQDGATPTSGLIIDGTGDLYGVTEAGNNCAGTVYEVLNPTGGAASITTVASFNNPNLAEPTYGFIRDDNGNFFGLATRGGVYGFGGEYEIAAGSDSVTTLASFNSLVSGLVGSSQVVDADDNIFGTTSGTDSIPASIFEIAAGSGSMTTLTYVNDGDGGDASNLLVDGKGNIYGITSEDGITGGTIFEIPSGENTMTTLVTLAETPTALTIDGHGNLFGLMYTNSDNSAFELASGASTITTLATFNQMADVFPTGNIVVDGNDNLYGVQFKSGAGPVGLFEITSGSNSITSLATFGLPLNDISELAVDTNGNLFGISNGTSINNLGFVFELVQGSSVPTVLYQLTGQGDGDGTTGASVVIDSDDNVYAASSTAGEFSQGYVFEVFNSAIAGRFFFYNDSTFNNYNAGGTAADLNAIATDKTALLPSQTATYSNLTDYSKGINGIIIDISNLPSGATLAPSDFQFATGDVNDTTTWTSLATSPTITLLPASGGITPVDLTWPNGTITNTWLQVTVLADANTGLASNDVSYFGNLIGKVSDSGSPEQVTALDLTQIENNIVGVATITNPYDVNKDGSVDAEDLVLTQRNTFSAIRLITPTGDGPALRIAVALPVGSSASVIASPLGGGSTGSSPNQLLLHGHKGILDRRSRVEIS